jgi:hypothetical protein
MHLTNSTAIAVPTHAEFEDSAAIGAWEQAGFEPQTLWFTIGFDHGLITYKDARAGDATTVPGYDFEFDVDLNGLEYWKFDWTNTTAQASTEYKNNWNMGFELQARAHFDGIEPEKVATEVILTIASDGTPWRTVRYLSRDGWWHGIPLSMQNNSGSGPDGAAGQLEVNYHIWPAFEEPTAQNLQFGTHVATVEWLNYNIGLATTLAPQNVIDNVRLIDWQHPD